MIRQAMQNLRAHGHLYAKALTICLREDATHCMVWTNFKDSMYQQYKQMLKERGGGTLATDGYRGTFNAIAREDTAILTESVVSYAEQSARTLAQVDTLRAKLEAMAMQQQANQGLTTLPTMLYTSHPWAIHRGTASSKSVAASTWCSNRLQLEDHIPGPLAQTNNRHSGVKLAKYWANL